MQEAIVYPGSYPLYYSSSGTDSNYSAVFIPYVMRAPSV